MSGEARPIEIRAGKAPQHHAIARGDEPSKNAGGKGGSERPVLLVAAGAQEFMQGTPRKTAARQGLIDRRNAKRRDPMGRGCRPLDPPDALAELGKKGPFRARGG